MFVIISQTKKREALENEILHFCFDPPCQKMKNEKGLMCNEINYVCDMGPKTGHIK